MCGFIYAVGKDDSPIPQVELQEVARNFVAPRGPTRRIEFSSKREYICQSILSVQSDPNLPSDVGQLGSSHFFLYNGEIFSTLDCQISDLDDTRYIDDLSKAGCLRAKLKKIDGMFAIAEIISNEDSASIEYGPFRDIWLHRDLAGEKHLYYWFNDKLFVVSSSPGAIAKLLQSLGLLRLDENELLEYIIRRHYISHEKTHFKGMFQVKPGHSLHFSTKKWGIISNESFDDIIDLFDNESYNKLSKRSEAEYINLLDKTLFNARRNYNETNRTGSSALVISGGIDSSLFSYYLQNTSQADNHLESFVCLFKDKDKSALNAKSLSQTLLLENHYDVHIDEDLYTNSLKRCIEIIAAPVHTHSLPSSRILGDFVAAKGHKVMYGGEGADELFLGYTTYIDILKKHADKNISSNYTKRTFDSPTHNYASAFQDNMIEDLYSFREKFIHFGMNKRDAAVKANSLLDYKYQLPMVGLIASDTVIADCGVEYRTPFTRKNILGFAINTPVSKLLGEGSSLCTKMPLTKLFKSKYSKSSIDPKIGFSGFPNESSKLLNSPSNWKVFDVFPFLRNWYGKNQAHDWKIINIEWFLRVWDVL